MLIEEKLKLTSSKTVTNLHLYNKDGTIKKYDTIYQIIDEHYYVRLNMYQKRKDYSLNLLEQEIKLLESKMRFIEYVIDEKIKVYRQTKKSIIDKLCSFEFPFYENDKVIEYTEKETFKNEYNYLLNLPVYSFTLEKVDALNNEITNKKNEYDELEKKDIKDIWKGELDLFEEKYKKM